MNELVSTNWLYKNLEVKKLVILDCSYFLANEKDKNAKNEYICKHIKNSHFFDIDKISNQKSKFPHMLPSKKEFENKIKNFGIRKDSIIITYDSKGIFSSTRVWWMFKYFGHKKIYVLNGGLKKWIEEKKPISKKKSKFKMSKFKCKINNQWLTNSTEILLNLNNNKVLIIDARNEERFKGKEKDFRKDIPLGHIPNSKNLFWKRLIRVNGTMISKRKMDILFNKLNIKDKKIYTSCGSGITSCIITFALYNFYNIKSSVYDGSWVQWSNNNKLPIENE